MQIPTFSLRPEIDAGAILTSLTIFGGCTAWLAAKFVAVRQERLKKAKSGALRLILNILHERRGRPASIVELWKTFESDEMKSKRKLYCGFDYRIKDSTQFEAAIYALDSEGKIDFYEDLTIVFRTDRKQEWDAPKAKAEESQSHFSQADQERVLGLLRLAVADKERSTWDLRGVVSAARNVDRDATECILNELLHGTDTTIAERAAVLLFEKAP